jgi:hypothetical protein
VDAMETGQFAMEVYGRRQEGIVLKRANPMGLIDPDTGQAWVPEEHRCYANVTKWVYSNPGDRVVYGCLYHETPEGPLLQPHAVIETGAGMLVDITPPGDTDARFIRHHGEVQQFIDFSESVPELGYQLNL